MMILYRNVVLRKIWLMRTESLSQYTDEQWSDEFKEVVKDLYPLEQINSFLDKTKGKAGVE